MLKRFTSLLFNCGKIDPSLLRPAICNFTTTSGSLLSRNSSNESGKKEEDEFEDVFDYQKSNAQKVKFLEHFGIIKDYAKWPKYNRIIYPPSEDGKLIKNPVISICFYLPKERSYSWIANFKFIHHMRCMIKYPAEKLWFPAFLVYFCLWHCSLWYIQLTVFKGERNEHWRSNQTVVVSQA